MPKGIVVRDAHFPGRAPIDAYGNGGFRFADMSHRGSILCLPSGIHGWRHGDDPLALEAFAPVIGEASGFEVLLIGAGQEPRAFPKALRHALSAAGIRADIMTTGAAVRTFNVLLAEDRAVAAALVAVGVARNDV